jgi:endonuclease/exonuclease/phosphatase family metal-dependent hydrolase
MPTFTLATFNISSAHHREGHFSMDNLDRLADCIRESAADVVCLQEVDRGAARSMRVDMLAYLARRTDLKHHYFIRIRRFQGGKYGTAILSRYPILAEETIHYPVHVTTQGTSCGYVTLDVEGTPVTVFNTHLSVESEEGNTETLLCLAEVLSLYARKSDRGFLCCGDFNTIPQKIARYLPWVNLANRDLVTYGNISIDHILYTAPYTVENTRTLDTRKDGVTDHNMVIAEVTV